MNLYELKLENCNLENFYPKGLGKLTKLELASNEITNLNSFILTKETNEEVAHGEMLFGRLLIPDINLTLLDMADN